MASVHDVWSAQEQLVTSDVLYYEIFCNPHATFVSDPHILLPSSFFFKNSLSLCFSFRINTYVVKSNVKSNTCFIQYLHISIKVHHQGTKTIFKKKINVACNIIRVM
jgi:hypothetical protein